MTEDGGCAGTVFYWLGRMLSEDKPYTRTVILSKTSLWLSRENSSRSSAGAGAFIGEDCETCGSRGWNSDTAISQVKTRQCCGWSMSQRDHGVPLIGDLCSERAWDMSESRSRFCREKILQLRRAFLRSSCAMIREVARPHDWFAWKLECIWQLKWHYFRSLAFVKDALASLFSLLFSHASPLL